MSMYFDTHTLRFYRRGCTLGMMNVRRIRFIVIAAEPGSGMEGAEQLQSHIFDVDVDTPVKAPNFFHLWPSTTQLPMSIGTT